MTSVFSEFPTRDELNDAWDDLVTVDVTSLQPGLRSEPGEHFHVLDLF